ncbi:cytochrome oxidase small assembly protein [Paenalcaligenes niemegkensis]|nr:cytochrome oxidase small assembly protein [Paenalcaligenes niemegkensis]MCQ9617720.1 cytochrome oxidase small assembly protein [Paenalcaligenes niemegkensis]
MTPEQRKRNRITGFILAVIVVAIMIWTFLRGGSLLG